LLVLCSGVSADAIISEEIKLTQTGFGCDIFGRRWAFNITLGIVAVWGMVAGSANNFAAIGSFAALWSFGVGGLLILNMDDLGTDKH
jgi:hypothetical protein